MKTKKSLASAILIAAAVGAVYIIFAVRPLGTEYQFLPEWKIDVTNPTVRDTAEGDTLLPFKLGQSMGYFTPEGKVVRFETFPFKASISRSFYTSYTANNSGTDFWTPDGEKAGTISASGFPMIDGDRIFVFQPGGSAFLMCSGDGSRRWEYSGAVPITAFDSAADSCVAGFADGTVCEFSSDGEIRQRFAPGGSDYPVILGAAISPDGEHIATVSGQTRQRFVLAKKDGVQTKIVFHEFLPSDEPLQQLVKFTSDSALVFYHCKDAIGIVSTRTGKSARLKMSGQAISLQELGNLVFVLTKRGRTYTVYAIEKFATPAGSFSFQADAAFILADGGRLYVGKDSTISCIDIQKK